MSGYHNKPEETASALRKGWYHTGDLAKSDRDDFLTITGRLKELIIRGGQNIAPTSPSATTTREHKNIERAQK
jgi:long-subunit acyl-CoA synthetase (AMP-forming)